MLREVIDSWRNNKKYVAVYTDRPSIHFGQKGSSTYIDHKDDKKRADYQARHSKLPKFDLNNPYLPSSLSWHILWGSHTNIDKNIKMYKRLYGL
jgi:hypothetical protein